MIRIKQFGILLGIGTFLVTSCNQDHNTTKLTAETKITSVKVDTICEQSDENVHFYIGTIEESISVPLSFLVSGMATEVLVDEGQKVRKDQLIAVLDSESYQNMYQVALAKAKQAEDAYSRLESMYKKGSLPEIKFVEIETGLEQANSLALISEKNLKDCKLYSPDDGIIGRRMIEPGMSVIPGKPVFQLVNIDKVDVRIPVPENEIAGINEGQKALIKVSALGDQQFEGEVTEVGVMSNPLSHTYIVKVVLNNADKILKPGMVCKVNISNPSLEERIVVPLSAVQVGKNDSKYIFIANPRSNRIIKKYVELGPIISNGVVVNSGLSVGDMIVVEGYQKINENSTVKIIK
jgi:RND family efflux transporter MFP subunit